MTRTASVAEALVQFLLQKDDAGLATRLRLVVHAVIGDDADHGAGRNQARDPVIDGAVEGVGLGRSRSMRVLDEIGQRQIEQARRLALEQAQAGVEHVDREVAGVLVGLRAAHHRLHVADAVLFDAGAVGVLGGEVDALQAPRQHQPQLVLGGNGRRLHARVGERGQDGAAAHQRGVRDHALLAGGAVEVVVAGDAVHRRRRAGHDRGVVGVGEGRHDGVGNRVEAVLPERGDRRQDAVGDAALDVGGIAPVEADHRRRPLGRPIAPPIHAHLCHRITPHARPVVIPGLVPGIQASARAKAIGDIDPEDKSA